MSRSVRRRWELQGHLIARSPVHVGNTRNGALLTQARDGLDRPVLSGAGLAGAIRAGLAEPGKRDSELWGFVGRNEDGTDNATGMASWVSVDDAVAPAKTVPQARDNVSIDRRTGTAARGHLFTREVLPIGTSFQFRLAVDDEHPTADSPAADLIHQVAALLRGTGFAVGGATTRGLGRVQLDGATLTRFDLDTRAGMLARLRGHGTPVDLTGDEQTLRPGVVRVTIPWRPNGPVMVQVSADGDAVNAFPLTTPTPDGTHLLLPGSSLKGVFRAHAERIMRTATGERAPARFLDQMKAEGLGPLGALFGTAGDERTSAVPARRGAITVHECRSAVALDTTRWRDVHLLQRRLSDKQHGRPADERRAALAALQHAVKALNDASDGIRFSVAPHVAVDRWTGGAADHLLFAVLEPHITTTGPVWQPMVLDIDTARLGEDADTALILMLLVLRDLCDGWIAFGHGTTRGMGAVTVDPTDITFQTSDAWPTLHGRNLAEVLADQQTLDTAIKQWKLLWTCRPTEGSPR